jgi:hypothetical protein
VVEPPRDWGPVQAEARRVKTPGGLVWMALTLMVRARVWLGGEVSEHRDMTLIQRLIAAVHRGAAPRPLWCCTDGWCAYLQSGAGALRERCNVSLHGGVHDHD